MTRRGFISPVGNGGGLSSPLGGTGPGGTEAGGACPLEGFTPTPQMVIPGEPEEMAAFQAATTEASRCALEVTLPSAHIFLPGKAFYERLYNR